MSNYSYIFNIIGVKLLFSTNNEDFASFVKGTLLNYLIPDNKHLKNTRVEIEVNVEFDRESRIEFSKFKIGNNITIDEIEKKICFKHGYFNGAFQVIGDKLKIFGDVSLTLKDKLQYFIKEVLIEGYSSQSMIFHQLYRELVLMPVFWWLRHYKGLYLMHASAIKDDDGVYVFVGNDGVGKTTIALRLLEKKGSLFFGDNFLLYDGERIYPFVDTLRVNKKNKRDIEKFDSNDAFTRVFEKGDRVHYNFSKKLIAEPNKPSTLFIIKQGKENNLELISDSDFTNITLSINDYVKEFDKYSFVSNLCFFKVNTKQTVLYESDILSKLSFSKPCGVLSLKKDNDLKEVLEVIKDIK